VELTDKRIAEMPLATLSILALAKCGVDIKKKVSQPTYSRHKAILHAYGIDITKIACNEKNKK